jgi:plasmid stability protein
MPQLLVRNVGERVVKRLKKRAAESHRSLEEEVRLILAEAAEFYSPEESVAVLEGFRRRLAGKKFGDSTSIIREERDR